LADENRKYKGFLLTELTVALTILGILLASLSLSLNGFRRLNHYQLARQRCTAAAQAQLDSIVVTGQAIPEEDFNRLWPQLSFSIEQSDGCGQWEGLKLVTVKTQVGSFGRDVEVRLNRYILGKAGQ